MPSAGYAKFDKAYGHRVVELIQALRVMKDSLDAIDRGDVHQFLPLFGLLRSLLADRSRGAESLLLAVGEEAGDSLEVHAGPGTEAKDSTYAEIGLPPPVFELTGFPVSLSRELPFQKRIHIADFLKVPIVRNGEKTYTTEKIIQFYANQFGGSHFSKQVAVELSDLLHLRINGLPALNAGLRQIGQLAFELGRRVLRRLCDFQILLFVAVPHQSFEKQPYILHYQYPGTGIELVLRATQWSGVSFSTRSFQGAVASVASGPIDWGSEPHWILLSHHVDDVLGSELELIVDGEIAARGRVRETMLVTNEFAHYQKFINRSAGEPENGMHFGFVRQMGILGETKPIVAAKWMTSFEQMRQDPANWGKSHIFRPGIWVEGPAGDRDIDLGELESVDTAEYLQRFQPEVALEGTGVEGPHDVGETGGASS